MNVCFVLQRQFAYISHYLAVELKKTYGVERFCGYASYRLSYEFLKKQNEIEYSTLLLDEDIHERWKAEKVDPDYLDFLEREYGLPSLWPYLIVDRVIMSNQLVREYPYNQSPYTHEEMLRMLQVHSRAIIDMLDREKPDVLFGIPPSGMGSMLLYHIAKKRGIRTLNIAPTNLRDRFILSEDYTTFTSVDARFKTRIEEIKGSPSWQTAVSFLEEFRKKPIPNFEKATPTHRPVTRKQQLKFLNPLKACKSLVTFLKSVHFHYQTNQRNDYTYIGPWNYLRDLFKRKARNLIGVDDLYDAFNPNEDFVFFPLHYEPELSLLLLAPYSTDQINLIRQIARSLPVQYKLVVKEHPVMVEYRPRWFYKQLKKVPNVKLVSPTLTSFQITPHAKMITTITGTVGWEACLFGVPVISFGHQNFNALPSVTFCKEIERLPELIREKLSRFSANDDDLLSYIACLYEDSVEVNLMRIWEEETDNNKKREGVKPLADLLARTIGLTAKY